MSSGISEPQKASIAAVKSVEDIIENAPFHLTDVDIELLSMSDSEFTPISWPQLKHYIDTHQLEELKRLPSQLRLYMAWCTETKQKYGSVTNFILQERVRWTPLPSADPDEAPRFERRSDIPFAERRDYCVLVNDWPYGLASGITHIVVWLKTIIPAEPGTGVITDEGRRLINDFVDSYFIHGMRSSGLLKDNETAENRIVWFKNWIKLQSVRAVEHVHVMVNGVPPDLIQEWCDSPKA